MIRRVYRSGGARLLRGAWILAIFLACVIPRSAPAATPGPPPADRSLETRTFKLVNDHRRSLGLPPFAYDARIAAVARRHSGDMAAGKVSPGHEGFDERRREISKKIPLKGIAENVGINNYPPSRTVRAAVSGWLESRGHKTNIEGRYDVTGVGIVRDARGTYYYTQIFVRRKP